VAGWSSADYQMLLLTRYVPIVRILAVYLTHEDMWCATSRELASKHKPEEMTKATLALSLLLSSKLILSTKAGAADTEETAWSALGLDRLCVRNLFSSPPSLPQKHVSQTSFFVVVSLRGFTSSIVLKRLMLLQWTGLVIFCLWVQH